MATRPFGFTFPVPMTSVALGGSDRVYTAPFPVPADVGIMTLKVGNRMFNGGVGSGFTTDFALYLSNGSAS